MDAPVAFLLEPSGRDFASTAMSGVQVQPVTIQPRGERSGRRQGVHRQGGVLRRRRPQPPRAGGAAGRGDVAPGRAVFEPVLRDGDVCGVLIVIWQRPLDVLPGGGRAACCGWSPRRPRSRSSTRACGRAWPALALTDSLTGLVTRRVFEEELPRELARARRADSPLSVAVARSRPHERVQHAARRGRGRPPDQGDRRRAGAPSCARSTCWRGFDGVEFALILPGCGLGEAVEVLDRVRARDAARADGFGRRGALGRRGAGRAADAARRRTRWPRRSRPAATSRFPRSRLSCASRGSRRFTEVCSGVVYPSAPEKSTAESLSPQGGRNGGPIRPWSGRWGESPP